MADSRLSIALVLALCLLVSAASCTSVNAARKLLYHDEPIHNETVIDGLKAYVSQPANTTDAAVVVFSDVFGWATPEIRQWADSLAEEGFIVIVPDFFRGDPIKPHSKPEDYTAWLERHPKNQTEQELPQLYRAIHEMYPNVTKIGAEGFCWGGRYAVLSCGGSEPPAQACVSYHGAWITPADINNITRPTLFITADPALDPWFNTTVFNELSPLIEQKNATGVPTNVTVFTGQEHGFALTHQDLHHPTPMPMTPEQRAAADEVADTAYDQGLDWLVTNLNLTTGT